MRTRRRLRASVMLGLTALFALVLAACAQTTVGPEAGQTPSSIPAGTSGAVSTLDSPSTGPAERTLLASPTWTFVPTEANSPGRTPVPCPPPPGDVPVPLIQDVLNFGDALLDYLNAGGSVEALAENAAELSLLGDAHGLRGFAQTDLDGDGIPEIVISLVDMFHANRPGRVYVAMCRTGAYQLAYSTPDDDYYRTAQIEAALDMTGDGRDDLVIRRTGCGAHTCFSWVEVVVWYQGKLQDLMAEAYFDLPSTSIQIFGPVTDGSYLIVMTGNGVASLGAGPYHRREVVWQFQQSQFQPVEVRFLTSDYRIHLVHNGDRSFARGNYTLALEYYNQVIHDRSLRDWPSAELAPEMAGDRPFELAAYARFRRVLTRLKMDDQASAQVHYQDLIDRHPPGSPGEGFARMGEVFWQAYQQSGDFDIACTAAQRFAASHEAEVLTPLDYGYSNPSYTPAGLCATAP